MTNVLTFDLGGTYIKYGVVNHDGAILTKDNIKTPEQLDELLVIIGDCQKNYSQYKLEGIAISAPGAVSDHGVIYGSSAIPFIHGPNIKTLIESKTGLAVSIENDANCAALAEVWKGSAVGKNDIAVVVIGTGIGGALIKNGFIHKGTHLHGGEFGYMILDSDNLGKGMSTFSEVASTYSIIKRVAYEKNIDPTLLTGENVFLQAEKGDEICQQAIEEFYRMLAIGLYNIQYMYDPELILIGGGISFRKELISKLKEELRSITGKIEVATLMPAIDRCYFSANANMVGAVYDFLQKTKQNN
ncbi:ROK family protein [Virgibacillus halodenitrificans]|uniref:ROK family protein n=1 Tax=Virgibacillus halodenitrificans TaxID=1482 RepID=UPI000760DDD7|nr:ROK family protein [Virgibacillus halodenitrificans]WHX26265.1 ROK family protein [Virgibacillus halodenitrificans]